MRWWGDGKIQGWVGNGVMHGRQTNIKKIFQYLQYIMILILTCTTYSTGQNGAPPPILIPIMLFLPFTRVTDRDIVLYDPG